ncbi:MAG: DUF2273 domain-containing protein [Rubrobacteraceae bacterium]|nr:DUF2273 domain-containing protein [Rubrobacteraceae bacterium]
MATWTNKQWGAVIGALALFSMYLIGFTQTLVVVLFGIIGYFIGKYLDGEIDTEDIRARAQGRRQNDM